MRTAWSATVVLVMLAFHPPPAAATAECDGTARLTPCGLEVVGGAEAWRADPVFSLDWPDPPADGGSPIVATHYRVLDAGGRIVYWHSLGGAPGWIGRLPVAPLPGIYTAEVWLQDEAGNFGEPATAQLRFDDAHPGPVEPVLSPGWIGRPSLPYPVRVGRAAGEPPLSGIRGYAITVDRDRAGTPCASPWLCTEAETDLSEGEVLWLRSLPEGRSYVHAVAVSGSGMRSASVGNAVLDVDTTEPTTTLHGAPSGWSRHPVTLVASSRDGASGMSAAGPAGPFTAIRVDGGAPVFANGETAKTTVIAPGVHRVAYFARDAAGNVDDGHGANPVPAIATVRIDPEPPEIAFAVAQDPRDPEAILVHLRDSLSGPSRSRGTIAVRPAGSSRRFDPLPTAVEDGVLRARWDSADYPPGRYEFEATGFDLAGNEGTAERRANGERMVLSAPLKRAVHLDLDLRWRAEPRPLSFGDRARLTGRLVGARHAGLPGMPVRVVERFTGERAHWERSTTLRTSDSGVFSLDLAPGPSRQVLASFAGTPVLSEARSHVASLAVGGRLWMRASARVATVGGPAVVFSGRVAGAVPGGGKRIQLQFRLPGGRWSEFRTIDSDARGRFRYAYRFSDDDSRGVRFQFRAYAAAQDDWPYEPVGSRPVVVRGR